jgi:hypothetical protein
MDADELEAVMARFIAGKTDVLVCTTIIESGLDIPNANTIISIVQTNSGSRICINCAAASVEPSTRRMPIFFCRAK